MGRGEGLRSVEGVAWWGDSALTSARPGSKDRQPGPKNPAEAKTPADALAHIALLYQSGRMEDLGKLLRKSQVFRAAWLILQQSSPQFSEAAGEDKGSSYVREYGGPAYLPIPAGGPPDPTRYSEPGLPGTEAAKAEVSLQNTPAGEPSDAGSVFFVPRSQAAHLLHFLLQAYLSQDSYQARERQRGQSVSIRA
jgi:hypothetical protein